MPDPSTLLSMYGPRYRREEPTDQGVLDPKEPGQVLRWLRTLSPGFFVDFGCGDGSLLQAAHRAGWQVAGVELSAVVSTALEGSLGLPVAAGLEDYESRGFPQADVLHLGDVVEHLTAAEQVSRQLVGWLRPGGVLLAQGPLEAGPSFYSAALGLGSLVRRRVVPEMAPYHVIQATVEGQRAFFRRLSLTELEYSVSEVAWPAPARVRLAHLSRPRLLALFVLRRFSQSVSALRPNNWGNRYFYAGQCANAS